MNAREDISRPVDLNNTHRPAPSGQILLRFDNSRQKPTIQILCNDEADQHWLQRQATRLALLFDGDLQ